jgi:hypothetical protein
MEFDQKEETPFNLPEKKATDKKNDFIVIKINDVLKIQITTY